MYKKILPADYSRYFAFRSPKRGLGGTILQGDVHEVNKLKREPTLMYGVPVSSRDKEGRDLIEDVKENWEKHFIMAGDELYRYLTNAEIRKYKVSLNTSSLYIVENKKFRKIITFTGRVGYLEPVNQFKKYVSGDTKDAFGDFVGGL